MRWQQCRFLPEILSVFKTPEVNKSCLAGPARSPRVRRTPAGWEAYVVPHPETDTSSSSRARQGRNPPDTRARLGTSYTHDPREAEPQRTRNKSQPITWINNLRHGGRTRNQNAPSIIGRSPSECKGTTRGQSQQRCSSTTDQTMRKHTLRRHSVLQLRKDCQTRNGSGIAASGTLLPLALKPKVNKTPFRA